MGTWSASLPEYNQYFGPADATRCHYTLTLKDLRASLTVDDDGEAQRAQVHYIYDENTNSRGCTGGIPHNTDNDFALNAATFTDNKVIKLEFSGRGTNNPRARVTFEGTLDNAAKPPLVNGTLAIYRNSEKPTLPEYNWTVSQNLILRHVD